MKIVITNDLLLKRAKLPALDVELILAYALKKSREFILTHGEYKLTKIQISKYNSLVNKRSKGEPLAYLIGHKEFYGLDFLVNKNVLIPRPETELMLDETLNLISHITNRVSLVDVGTGSGCIAITLAKKIKKSKFIATDISERALAVAKKNTKKHKVDKTIKLFQGNLLEPIIKKQNSLEIRNCNLVILANLPYLTPAQIKNSPPIQKEPKLALAAGNDGLKYYRELFTQIKKLNEICDVRYALCEIDPRQKNRISTLIKKELFTHRSFSEGGPGSSFQIKKDLKGHSRLVVIKFLNHDS